MLSEPWEEPDLRRLQHMKENRQFAEELLSDYQRAWLIERDPGTKRYYADRIAELKDTIKGYEQEYNDLRAKVRQQSPQLAQEGAQLKQLKEQIDSVLASQAALQALLDDMQASILTRLDTSEQTIITTLVARLDQEQLQTTQAVLDGLKANQIPQQELQEALSAVKQALSEAHQHGGSIAAMDKKETEHLAHILEEPKLDMSQKLHVSIPIIPLLLSYETDIGLESGINLDKLKKAWAQLTSRVRKP